MSNRLIDNKQYGLVGDVLKENLQEGSKLTIMAAHFTLYAFQELKDELLKLDEFRFLFTQPTFVENKYHKEQIKQNEQKLFGLDEEISYQMNLNQAYLAREFSKWLKKKGEVKSFVSKSMSDSLYYVESQDEEDVCLKGPSTFSAPGLGYVNSESVMLNQMIVESKFNQQIKDQIDYIWNDEKMVKDVKADVLKKLETLYEDHSPEFLYFVTLYNIFKTFLEENEQGEVIQSATGFKKTVVWNKLYNFQRDGVVGAINKINKFGGCIIADSVGLGKTFEALAVIKYYELNNHKVLVLCPKKLRENWLVYRQQNDIRNPLADDRFSYDLLNHTDLSRNGGKSGDIDLDYVNWGNYGLVVIDESHNFRNNTARNDRETRYSKLMNNIIKSGIKTKVLMLSATPVNNHLQDLRNQISFITEENDQALVQTAEIESIKKVISQAQSAFNQWGKLSENERTTESLLELLDFDYFKLLDSLTIARSRKHIEKYYNVKDIGQFPKRLRPITVKSEIDTNRQFPAVEEIYREILGLNMAIYSPMRYILPHKRAEYEKKYDTVVKGGKSVFKQSDRERSLIYLITSGLLKRLESSIHSFNLTLSKIQSKIDYTLDSVTKFDQYSVELEDEKVLDDELEDFIVGDKVSIKLSDLDVIKWRQDLEEDLERMNNILIHSTSITSKRDQKLQQLKELMTNKFNHPINGENKKIIIFTAYADTAKYLYEQLSNWVLENYQLHTALVTGSDNPKTTFKMKKIDLNSVLLNFSPISKERGKLQTVEDEIDILIATDCISEGQNLQDCDYLINYDIHWNPVRIIQRFGRVDRLGSRNEQIQLVNFWPSVELDEYINLENRVKQRMKMLDLSATGEDDVIAEDSNTMKDLEYRRNQLVQLQDAVIDLEDVQGSVSLTDFTMDDFRMDLMNLSKKYETYLDNIPPAMFALVQNQNEQLKDEIKPGVIFCLKRVECYDNNESNPIYPYYLVYVTQDQEVYYSYGQVKKILDLYRSLCHGTDNVLKDLVSSFNKETKFNKKMDDYIDLLKIATDEIIGKSNEEEVNSIFSFGGLNLFNVDQTQNKESFEVITYLIIKGVS
ncbi:helicase-related protein [Turicibacter sanguinis]|uniref:helicase-related protein n=1 Tax=Turicibacter sanguinis TaxID=154288 RepID=UPI00189CA513|nr:helicase-related protein [Turicibacter sanguinis]